MHPLCMSVESAVEQKQWEEGSLCLFLSQEMRSTAETPVFSPCLQLYTRHMNSNVFVLKRLGAEALLLLLGKYLLL